MLCWCFVVIVMFPGFGVEFCYGCSVMTILGVWWAWVGLGWFPWARSHGCG